VGRWQGSSLNKFHFLGGIFLGQLYAEGFLAKSMVLGGGGVHSFFPIIFVFFFFTYWYYVYHIFSFVLGVFPCHSLFFPLLLEEMQLSGYHRFWGCSIAMVDCVKDFLYSRFLFTRRYQGQCGWISCFIVIFTSLPNFRRIFHFGTCVLLGGTLSNKIPFPPVVRIECHFFYCLLDKSLLPPGTQNY